ncbi:DUF6090 family protein [Robiginitalea marina]|uniref:DUF6090 family protein n=1 Tax=Robiginitalea marina TaxID=2954105 RepID=A0ABT1AVR7_9FLAO|nr:DUF6090 family protein [Robiginitalea marina]MCO5724144.1 DUF6090 family protein [Robiginitalea marina]
MFRFFRTLRQRLVTENKYSKYLLYAFGEIMLVVIGIVIALQIDNWNEERKLRIEEQILLKQLKDEYIANLEQLDGKIAIRNLLIKSSKELLTCFDNPDAANRDSVISRLGNLSLTVTYDPIDNDLVASGKINMIQNEKLKKLLTKWSTDVIQVQEVEVIYLNAHNNVNFPALSKFGLGRAMNKALYDKVNSVEGFSNFLLNRDELFPYDFKNSRLEPDLQAILNNPELEGMVSNSIFINELINSESATLRKQILDILDLLPASEPN